MVSTAEAITTSSTLTCGTFAIPSSYTGTWPRASLTQDDLAVYDLPLSGFVVHDSGQPLPAAAANDDLGYVNGTFGSATSALRSTDGKATTVTLYGRTEFVLPPEYVTGETVQVRLNCKMVTTVSDTSATVDVEAYEWDSEGGVGSDLCTTAAQSINSLTAANKTFTINPAGLAAGDKLDIRVTIAITDSATGTAVIGSINRASILADVKG